MKLLYAPDMPYYISNYGPRSSKHFGSSLIARNNIRSSRIVLLIEYSKPGKQANIMLMPLVLLGFYPLGKVDR